eukprot:TRINITY_DN9130_c0_g1_i1.p1 TRINITY_DN9130_c0_g1~~TRINITY_DN9130_c0_g1_i1.p1  ORF type:complete len:101 (+),score=12.40 TRINITY_DN9130_c0_g1_i1:37-339(+)
MASESIPAFLVIGAAFVGASTVAWIRHRNRGTAPFEPVTPVGDSLYLRKAIGEQEYNKLLAQALPYEPVLKYPVEIEASFFPPSTNEVPKAFVLPPRDNY